MRASWNSREKAATAAADETAFRLHALTWSFLGASAALFWLLVTLTGFRVAWQSVAYCYGICLSLGGFAFWRLRQTAPVYLRTTFVLGAVAQLLLTTVIFAPGTYVVATLAWPLQDAALYAADKALGLDWRSYLDFVNDHPWLGGLLSFGYKMIRWPMFAIPLVLGLCGHALRLNQFVLAFALALAATTIMSAFVPAVAAFAHLGLTPADYANIHPLADSEHLADLRNLRAGAFAVLDIRQVTGIVTFPSFHAASCLLYAWALWRVWWMRPAALIANGLMLAATPIDGGHYFVDVAAGLTVAAVAIWSARLISRRLTTGDQRTRVHASPLVSGSRLNGMSTAPGR
jgi:hypothetical protein